MVKLAMLLLSLIFLLFGEHLFPPGRPGGIGRALASCHRLLTGYLAAGLPAAALLLLPFSYAQRPAGISIQKSAVGQLVSALGGSGGEDELTLHVPMPSLLGEFRLQTATPHLDEADTRIAAEDGADILLFVMETGSARFLDLVNSGRSLPGTGRLYDHSFVGGEHFTTYPYTSDAVYSILSGLYPEGRRRLLEAKTVQRKNGLMSALDADYTRGVYAPNLYRADVDDLLYRTFGADRTFYASDHPQEETRGRALSRAAALMAEMEAANRPFDPSMRQKLLERLTLDLQALEQLKADILAAKEAGRHFCALFLPQIGHGPFFDLRGLAEISARGHELALLQDRWLAEIIDLLTSHRWLENTIVVFTADHGVRSQVEDPALPFGKLSSYMLQVPLLIYAPRALQHSLLLSAPTSHIDIAPTLLALLGKTAAAKEMEGIPVWQRSGKNRIFLLGSGYAGADGFVQDGFFYMHNVLSDAVYRDDRLSFTEKDLLLPKDARAEAARSAIRQARALQFSMVHRLFLGDAPLAAGQTESTAMRPAAHRPAN